MIRQGYDVIGDIHGHAEELIRLLETLGYKETATGYHHASRQAIFLGDFIDGPEGLRQHRQLMETVMPMVHNDHALAVMGNHEFNALAFHTMHEGSPLRPHSRKNVSQHQSFLNEFDHEPALKQNVLDFFWRLPLWLDLGDLRVVHACWHEACLGTLEQALEDHRLDHASLVAASTSGTELYKAVEIILKGIEKPLPEGIEFVDKRGNKRGEFRVQWWNSAARTLGEVALPVGVDIGEAAHLSVPEDIPVYDEDAPPCLVGHYWMGGEPAPQSRNVACLDYSVAKGGKLVAYRWDGEQTLRKEKFVYVDER